MKFSLTIEGDSSLPSDLRTLREISALLNSTAAAPSAQPVAAIPQSVTPQPIPPAVSGMTATAASDDGDAPAAAGTSFPGVDKDGLPWDIRIHAGSGTKNADGSWRSKRGLDPMTKQTVEAELRARVGAAPVVATVPPPTPAPVIAQPVAMPPMPAANVAPAAAIPVPQPQPVLPPPLPVPAPAPVAAAQETVTISAEYIFALIEKSVAAGKMTAESIQALAAHLGVTDLTMLVTDPGKHLQAYQFIANNGWYVG